METKILINAHGALRRMGAGMEIPGTVFYKNISPNSSYICMQKDLISLLGKGLLLRV